MAANNVTLKWDDITRQSKRYLVGDSANWFTKAKDCDRVYSGLNISGRILQTYVRGNLIYSNGEIAGERGYGQFLRPN